MTTTAPFLPQPVVDFWGHRRAAPGTRLRQVQALLAAGHRPAALPDLLGISRQAAADVVRRALRHAVPRCPDCLAAADQACALARLPLQPCTSCGSLTRHRLLAD